MVQGWIDRYVEAWRSNDPDAIGALFAADATYFTHPYRTPWSGRGEIVQGWLRERDDPSSWSAEYQAIASTGNLGVVRGETVYRHPDGSERTRYANLFVIEFEGDGTARSFTEFFMERNPPTRHPGDA